MILERNSDIETERNINLSNQIKRIDYTNGDRYLGECDERNFKHGTGTYTYDNGFQYVGEFKEDKKDGQGTITYPSGTKYVGEFKEDKKHGKGTLNHLDGSYYVGEF